MLGNAILSKQANPIMSTDVDMVFEASSFLSTSQQLANDNPQTSLRTSRVVLKDIAYNAENVASVAQQLVDALQAIKAKKRKGARSSKTRVTISMIDFDNLIARSQQIARLTATSRHAQDPESSESLEVDDATALSSQGTSTSDRIAASFERSEPHLEEHAQGDGPETPAPLSAGLLSSRPRSAPGLPIPSLSLKGQRHESLYFPDGNIVLAAPSTNAEYSFFRVHKSTLSFHSPIFASMFKLPAPENVAHRETYDGVPLVQMPDSSTDLESLLRVLYDPSALPYKRLDPQTPILVYGMLAMATKYEMDSLRSRIVSQVEADWPTSLSEWDRFEAEAAAMAGDHEDAEESGYLFDGVYLDDRLPEPGAAIRLAIDFDIPQILPAAFYHLSRIDPRWDWDECHGNYDCLDDNRRTVKWQLLHATDFRRLLLFRDYIVRFDWEDTLKWKHPKTCVSPSACRLVTERIVQSWKTVRDPLRDVRLFVSRTRSGLCKSCWGVFRTPSLQLREILWGRIVDFDTEEIES